MDPRDKTSQLKHKVFGTKIKMAAQHKTREFSRIKIFVPCAKQNDIYTEIYF